ncbi:MAG: hypothetical protein GF411_20340 [Candidatus Lokiarchaeota archaeon]|nr:hypothetical protein [Candidatus Lokiarchaeota archaeon]
MIEEYPPKCPRCNSREIIIKTKHEYTGGGYADRWDEFYCEDCDYEWKSETTSDYA